MSRAAVSYVLAVASAAFVVYCAVGCLVVRVGEWRTVRAWKAGL